jgi:hypothetical protein
VAYLFENSARNPEAFETDAARRQGPGHILDGIHQCARTATANVCLAGSLEQGQEIE